LSYSICIAPPAFMKFSRRLFLFAATLTLLGGCAVIESKQSEWIFRPVRDNWRGYQGLPAGTEEVWLKVPHQKHSDGKNAPEEKINGWWAPQPDPNAPVVLYLHGSRWNLTGSSFRIERWRAMGFAVFAIDYRGFGQSSGDTPTEANAYEDAAIAWDWLKAKVPDASKRYLYGHSLGGAVAIDLATKLKADEAAGLILEATFTSVPDVVSASKYGWIPVGFLITQRFASFEKIGKVNLPKLFLHGTADTVVPHEMSDELFKLATEPKRLVKFEGAGHSGSSWTAPREYADEVLQFVASAKPRLTNSAAVK
jgi:uncharacterized protein